MENKVKKLLLKIACLLLILVATALSYKTTIVTYGTPAHTHSWGSWSDYSSTQHRRKCSNSGCSYTNGYQYENHSGATHANGGKCSTCGHAMQTHSAASSWTTNSTQHWKKCTYSGCTGTYSKANHSGGTATCTAKPTCSTCSTSYGSNLGRTRRKYRT